jgi:hypothetical protein
MCENDFWLRHVFHDCSHNADVYLFCRLLERAATLIQVKSFDHKERSSEIMRHRTKLLLLPPAMEARADCGEHRKTAGAVRNIVSRLTGVLLFVGTVLHVRSCFRKRQ